jgi:DnaD/phage-associated family protein
MKAFPGFPPGQTPMVALPEALFGELAPLIDDLAELKVTLHCYWRLSQGQGAIRFLRRRDLLTDPVLLGGLESDAAKDRVGVIETALERARARGSLLHVRADRDGESEDWYFANTPKGRAALQQIERGERPEELQAVARAEISRPNIFVLYEQNIGMLQSIIADELREAEREYPADWIEEAFQLAAEANVRRWSYVRAILERWATEGKSDAKSRRDSQEDYRRFTTDKYADLYEQ